MKQLGNRKVSRSTCVLFVEIVHANKYTVKASGEGEAQQSWGWSWMRVLLMEQGQSYCMRVIRDITVFGWLALHRIRRLAGARGTALLESRAQRLPWHTASTFMSANPVLQLLQPLGCGLAVVAAAVAKTNRRAVIRGMHSQSS